MKNTQIVIIGRPNVGKSSLFNRAVRKRQAIVHDVAGTTRDIITETVTEDDKCFDLTDTAGYLNEKGELPEKALAKVKEGIELADILLFVVDGNVAPTQVDLTIAALARKSKKKVFLVINKIDNSKKTEFLTEYLRLGFKDIYTTSVIHNLGVGPLLTELMKLSGKSEARAENPQIKIAIAGRPNVGKSSILNAILGSERAIVSNIPGTTRDVVTQEIEGEEITFRISDTAGARKPGKIGMAAKRGEPIEKYSFLRTQREIVDSDIIIIVIDASEKIAAQDLHIAGYAKEEGKGIILVINKWDLVKEVEQDEFLRRLRQRFSFMIWVPAVFISAKTGRNIKEVLSVVKTVAENQRTEINTSKLNRILEDFALRNTPKGVKNIWPKVFFVAQTAVVPPTFTITTKHHEFVHFSWTRSFENELRRHFDFTGTPVKVIYKKK